MHFSSSRGQSSLDCLPQGSVNVLVVRRSEWTQTSQHRSPNCPLFRDSSCWSCGRNSTGELLHPGSEENSWFPFSPTKFRRTPMEGSNLRPAPNSGESPEISKSLQAHQNSKSSANS